MMAAVASSAVPRAFMAPGLRKASISPISLWAPVFASTRLMFSVSMECPKRYTVWANSAKMLGLMSVVLLKTKGSIRGCT
ncbi:hypothetical protein D3C72_2106460 [compost metagenome]